MLAMSIRSMDQENDVENIQQKNYTIFMSHTFIASI